tara:strand:+ start:34 stop:387 length:354 start_codon:yes stop_codon:yes gene_type:complete
MGAGQFVVFEWPPSWSEAGDRSSLPHLISVVVREECRNQGAGTFLLKAAEEEIRYRGCKRMHLATEQDDAGAQRLYLRFGFEILSDKPRRKVSMWTDDEGKFHEDVEYFIDMRKTLD